MRSAPLLVDIETADLLKHGRVKAATHTGHAEGVGLQMPDPQTLVLNPLTVDLGIGTHVLHHLSLDA